VTSVQRRSFHAGGLATAALLGAALVGNAWSETACRELTHLELEGAQIHAAEPVAAGPIELPNMAGNAELPAFCRVRAGAPAAISFEVWLPSDWNGRFQGVGNGGMAGAVSYAAMATALRSGYAVASTDTGHHAGEQPFDASWARGRPDLIEDFGHRSLHVTTVQAKVIASAYYGTEPTYAYYVGCSKGGQEGLMEAQRYPEDYDGLLVGNPAHDWTRFYAGAHLWYSLATLANPGAYIPAAKIPALGAAVEAACDALDGVTDGILLDPRRCRFDPGTLACPADTDRDDCLTGPQVDAARKIYAGARRADGTPIFPGLVPGGEAAAGGWALWVTGDAPFRSLHWLAGEGFFRHFVFEDPDWDFRTFSYERDLPFALKKVGGALDAADPDLSALRDRGAKLLLYHGWSDADISPLASIDYFDRVVATQGGSSALEDVQAFFRLFMVPGLGHCRGGPGPDRFDGLAALRQWVEEDVAPDTIVASKIGSTGAVVRSLPLCPYPAGPQFSGRGDPTDAASYECRGP
jgi:feruloyl esterase